MSILSLFLSTAVYAQDAQSNYTGLDDIVVTAGRAHPTTARECIVKVLGDTAEGGFLEDWKATGQELV